MRRSISVLSKAGETDSGFSVKQRTYDLTLERNDSTDGCFLEASAHIIGSFLKICLCVFYDVCLYMDRSSTKHSFFFIILAHRRNRSLVLDFSISLTIARFCYFSSGSVCSIAYM